MMVTSFPVTLWGNSATSVIQTTTFFFSSFSSPPTQNFNTMNWTFSGTTAQGVTQGTTNGNTGNFMACKFNFTIPQNAKIIGINVGYNGFATSAILDVAQDSSIYLIRNAGGALYSSNAVSSAIGKDQTVGFTFPANPALFTPFGSSSNLWGCGELTPALINSTGFGVSLDVDDTGPAVTPPVMNLNLCQMQVWYTP